MNRTLMAGISALSILAANVAFAQGGTTNGGVVAGAGSVSISESGARAEAFSNGFTDNSNSDVDAPAIAPNLAGLYASPHTCMGSATASVGVGGVFSAGVGSTYNDDECNKREAVKLAAQLGLKGAAAAVFYDIEVVRNVVGNAQNAGEVARAEAAQLAGVQITPAAPAARTTSTEAAPAASNGGKPWWCSSIDRNNARWNECQ